MDKMDEMYVAVTILEQLGGNKFITMTGAKCWTYDETSITFKIGRNSGKVQFFKVTLNALDLYDLEFYKHIKDEKRMIEEVKGVFNDQLQEIFNRVTGMDTHL
jgi:hypothetical protein